MKQLLPFIFLFGYSIVNAQFHQSVFSNLDGDELRVQVKETYKPDTILGYGPARDTMFSKIDNRNDSLTCVYTGHTIYLNPLQDPTEAAYMNGNSNGINTEHTYPQAFGASSGNPRSDMHHLFPTRTPVNTARGNLPFGEITDSQTDTWYYLNQESSSVPGQNIDEYSEVSDNRFEPREDHKGDVARAMFYFYTMYTAEANAGNPSFFENQRNTFCEWHFEDPVDQKEWDRTWRIAEYQEDKPNPFVLDCTLAARLHCTEFEADCVTTPVKEIEKESPIKIENRGPNPFKTSTTLSYQLEERFVVKLLLFNSIGQLMGTLINEQQAPGTYAVEINKEHLSSQSGGGCLFLQFQLTNESQEYFIPQRLIYLPD